VKILLDELLTYPALLNIETHILKTFSMKGFKVYSVTVYNISNKNAQIDHVLLD